MAIAPERMGIGIHRQFTTAGQDPYDTVEWERRDARIAHFATGAVAFEQLGVEVPAGWSFNATNILAQKYFRGTLGTPEREWSLKQVADRVVDTITGWGRKDGYFVDDDEAETFRAELKYLIIHQKAAFNSPVWFNIGVEGVPQQARRASSWPSTTRWTRSSTGTPRRGPSSRAGPGPASTCPRSAPPRRVCGAGGPPRARSASCGGPTPRPGRSRAAARPAGPPRWSSSTSTTPTSRTSSGARPSRSARPGPCATPGSTWTSTARTATRSSTRTPTTRSG